MRETIEYALDWIVKAEGGYVNHPDDPGGETKFGISKRAYPDEDVRNLTVERARELYRRDYWTPGCVALDRISPSLALAYFDACVNMGRGAALRCLRRAVGFEDERGWMDVERALEAYGPEQAVDAFLLQRAFYYASLAHARTFLRGWLKRLRELRAACVEVRRW